ncbi:uncharacterized protein (TIGR03084 family) [Rhodococcus sp. OAS809]|uniref:TIGR03084 family metal-binding protein n=1 Tax=Rhodococcus sp. OAS809 TaxID=2663874 RepID=UPI0017890EAD
MTDPQLHSPTAATAALTAVLADLHAESESLDQLVAHLPARQWTLPTPATGWTIAHQIGHLLWTDLAALHALTQPETFHSQYVVPASSGDPHFADTAAENYSKLPPAILHSTWRMHQRRLSDALHRVPPGTKLAWFGPPMKPTTMTTARLMETWAHGHDVADALGVTRTPTARLRSIADLGIRTRAFSFTVHQLSPPRESVRVELTVPTESAGERVWTWGPEDAPESVMGSALDFCLLVTKRAHRDDLDLKATGPGADRWLDIAQAFAGPPGPGREPSSTGRANSSIATGKERKPD